MRDLRFLAVAALLCSARLARAHPMFHHDLAGLVMQSDAIVVAERIRSETPSQYSRIETFRVERVLRGTVAKAAEIAVETFLYGTEREGLDREAVLFLKQRLGATALVPSGLRVLKAGKVFRFEQWNNPGGWQMVAQGHDPQDNWQAGVTPIDLATFERELGAAVQRVDALPAALALGDRDRRRAALLALFVPPGGPEPFAGFFVDNLAAEAEQALYRAGDLEGALLITERDRSHAMGQHVGTAHELLPFAADPARPIHLRVAAIHTLARGHDLLEAPGASAALALLDDPVPAIRTAAVELLAPGGGGSSDPEEDALMKKLAREERAALVKRFASERDNDVLYAIADDLEHPPARKGPPDIAAHARLVRGDLEVRIRCLRPGVRVTAAALVIGPGDKPTPFGATRVEAVCGDRSDGFDGAGIAKLPAGSYPISLQARVGGKPLDIPLGTLVASGNGERSLVP